MRFTALAAIVLSAALLAAGCGGGGSEGSSSTAAPKGGGAPKTATAPNAPAGSKVVDCGQGLRAAAVDCGTAERIERRWEKHRSCSLPDGASRGSCSLGPFRCQAVRAGDGIAVSCARPGGDIAFIANRP
ncbi:MAG: hypothetical protein JST59_18070 [Actinobacteria bacterium]|nr:hypothetical protein [Actinomycetota bacterium]